MRPAWSDTPGATPKRLRSGLGREQKPIAAGLDAPALSYCRLGAVGENPHVRSTDPSGCARMGTDAYDVRADAAFGEFDARMFINKPLEGEPYESTLPASARMVIQDVSVWPGMKSFNLAAVRTSPANLRRIEYTSVQVGWLLTGTCEGS